MTTIKVGNDYKIKSKSNQTSYLHKVYVESIPAKDGGKYYKISPRNLSEWKLFDNNNYMQH